MMMGLFIIDLFQIECWRVQVVVPVLFPGRLWTKSSPWTVDWPTCRETNDGRLSTLNRTVFGRNRTISVVFLKKINKLDLLLG